MSEIWVDTDFGFDDLWALLLLRQFGCRVAGVSLVAGNAPLPQVAANAMGARAAYGLRWPVWQGAAHPIERQPETAERILGASGMRSRGARLPVSRSGGPREGALAALLDWLGRGADVDHEILALGPLTNIALLLEKHPDVERHVDRLVWMGGSTGDGNHTANAEFNAFADPEALEIVLNSGLRIDIVDLEFCRGVTFGPENMPVTDTLTSDLLGGYLDIALERGRPAMTIFDPVAALALADPVTVGFTPCSISVSVEPDDSYGATSMETTNVSKWRLATVANADLADICLGVLQEEAVHARR